MLARQICIALSITVFCSVSLAQDPTKVEPRHYSIAFQNESVEVVNVHYGPHEKSALHDHPGGVVVVLTPGHLRFTDEGGRTREVYAKAGESRWFPPLKHRVENLGDTAYNAVYVGIRNSASAENSGRPGQHVALEAYGERQPTSH